MPAGRWSEAWRWRRRGRPAGARVAIARALADRLALRVGDPLRIGTARLTVSGVIGDEPDALGEGFALGPRALLDLAGLDATGLVQPGSLYEARYRIALPPGADAEAAGTRLERRFPSQGWSSRTAERAAGGLRRSIGQLGQFLLLVGLAALAIAGVGVGSGVAAYLAGKTRIIATLKVLGARSGTIAAIFLLQLGLVAGIGIAAGLALGAAVPWRRGGDRRRRPAGRRRASRSIPFRSRPPRRWGCSSRCSSRCPRSPAPARCPPRPCSATRWPNAAGRRPRSSPAWRCCSWRWSRSRC